MAVETAQSEETTQEKPIKKSAFETPLFPSLLKIKRIVFGPAGIRMTRGMRRRGRRSRRLPIHYETDF